MTTLDYINIDPDVIMSMTNKDIRQLKHIISVMSSTANKRIKRLSQSDVGRQSPAYVSAMRRSFTTADGGKFGVPKNASLNQLKQQYLQTKNFLSLKTSSLSGFEKYRKETYKRIAQTSEGYSQNFKSISKEVQFWDTYNKLISQMDENFYWRDIVHDTNVLQSRLLHAMSGSNIQQMINYLNDDVNADMFADDEYVDNNGNVKRFENSPEGIITLVNDYYEAQYVKRQIRRNSRYLQTQ